MSKTISFHNGKVFSRGHNIRDDRFVYTQEHIDRTLSEKNVILYDVPLRQAYDEIFRESVEEYNSKQKMKSRRIDSYYDKIKSEKQKNVAYECIVQIGDKDDTGNTAQQEREALLKYAYTWNDRNPNLRLVGAYLHADEPNGTVHLHMDYIPVAQCTRGMKIQNSMNRALQQQGFTSTNIHKTALMAWQDSERKVLENICVEFDIDAKANQQVADGREYLSPKEYKRAKDKQAALIEDELQKMQEEAESQALSIVAEAESLFDNAKQEAEEMKNKAAAEVLEIVNSSSSVTAEYEAKKAYVDKVREYAMHVASYEPEDSKIYEKGLLKKQKRIDMPYKTFEDIVAGYFYNNHDKELLKAAHEKLDKKIEEFKESASGKHIKELEKELNQANRRISQLKESESRYNSLMQKINRTLDRCSEETAREFIQEWDRRETRARNTKRDYSR